MGAIDLKLKELNVELPNASVPAANYIPYKIVGNMVYMAGQTCKLNGKMIYAGKVGLDYNIEEAQQAARLCGLNIVAQLKNACGGDLDKVKSCVKINIYSNSTDDFKDQALVANGVSDLIVEIFGEKGKHARASVSCNALPSQSAVEVDAIFEIE